MRFLFATDEVLEKLRDRLQAVVSEGVRVLTYNYSAPWFLGAIRSLALAESPHGTRRNGLNIFENK